MLNDIFGKKSKPMKTSDFLGGKVNSQKGLVDLFVGKSHPKLKDKVTRAQKQVLQSNDMKKMFGDWDKDGVINALDCRPRDRHRHSAGITEFVSPKKMLQPLSEVKDTFKIAKGPVKTKVKVQRFDNPWNILGAGGKELSPYSKQFVGKKVPFKKERRSKDIVGLGYVSKQGLKEFGVFGKTKAQKDYLKKTVGFKPGRFIDHDGDGVISGLDCAPMNPLEHGFADWLKERKEGKARLKQIAKEKELTVQEIKGRALPEKLASATERLEEAKEGAQSIDLRKKKFLTPEEGKKAKEYVLAKELQERYESELKPKQKELRGLSEEQEMLETKLKETSLKEKAKEKASKAYEASKEKARETGSRLTEFAKEKLVEKGAYVIDPETGKKKASVIEGPLSKATSYAFESPEMRAKYKETQRSEKIAAARAYVKPENVIRLDDQLAKGKITQAQYDKQILIESEKVKQAIAKRERAEIASKREAEKQKRQQPLIRQQEALQRKSIVEQSLYSDVKMATSRLNLEKAKLDRQNLARALAAQSEMNDGGAFNEQFEATGSQVLFGARGGVSEGLMEFMTSTEKGEPGYGSADGKGIAYLGVLAEQISPAAVRAQKIEQRQRVSAPIQIKKRNEKVQVQQVSPSTVKAKGVKVRVNGDKWSKFNKWRRENPEEWKQYLADRRKKQAMKKAKSKK